MGLPLEPRDQATIATDEHEGVCRMLVWCMKFKVLHRARENVMIALASIIQSNHDAQIYGRTRQRPQAALIIVEKAEVYSTC